jgi:hypothetical protein
MTHVGQRDVRPCPADASARTMAAGFVFTRRGRAPALSRGDLRGDVPGGRGPPVARTVGVVNAGWHRAHVLGRDVPMDARIAWHLEHARECAC